jgi:hypothetical protein
MVRIIRRLPLVGILAILLISTLEVQSQDQRAMIKVPPHSTNITFTQWIAEIEETQNLHFFYLEEWIQNINVIKSYEGELLFNVLEELLQGRDISFEFMFDYAVILVKDIDKEIVRDKLITRLSTTLDEKVLGNKAAAKWGNIVSVTGKIIDKKYAAPITGAVIYANEENLTTITDSNGRFELTLPVGKHILGISSLNFDEKYLQLFLYEGGEIDIILEERPITLGEVVIRDESMEENFNNAIGGKTHLTATAIQKVPALLGEVDVIKSIQLLPGVTTVGEGSAGFNVRGGGVDQNLILLDEAIVFNPTHLFGFFSAFHPDALRDVTFYRGAIPANYGGRISSVLDVKQKDGSTKEIKGSGGIGVISSRLLVEGPILADKISFMLAGRSSYSDWILRNARNLDLRQSSASFYDVTGKVSGFIDENNKVSASYYLSKDQFQFPDDTLYNWQNRSASINYERVITSDIRINAVVSSGSYQYDVIDEDADESFSRQYGIDNKKVNLSLNWALDNHKLIGGGDMTIYDIKRGELKPLTNESSISEVDLGAAKARVIGVFVSDEYKIRNGLIASAGIRYSIFDAIGPMDTYLYSEDSPLSDINIVDTMRFESNSSMKRYTGIEPRLSLKYELNSSSFFKLGLSRSNQYLHLISNTTAITPIDVWVPSSSHIKPQIGTQYSLGYFKKIPKKSINASVEVFYKKINNVPEYKNGAQLILKENIETELVNSNARSRGVEFSIQKEGRLSGGLNYTYSRSERQTESEFDVLKINDNQWFASNYDRPHDLKINTNYDISKRYVFSFNFNLTSGRPLTLPSEKFEIEGISVSNFGNRNAARLPTYHRMDVSLLIRSNHKKNKLWEGSWIVTFYNVYARKNAYSIFFSDQIGGVPQANKLSILGTVLPSITYNFKF